MAAKRNLVDPENLAIEEAFGTVLPSSYWEAVGKTASAEPPGPPSPMAAQEGERAKEEVPAMTPEGSATPKARRPRAVRGEHGYSVEETESLRKFLMQYAEAHSLSWEQMVDRMATIERKPAPGGLWDQVAAVLPLRSKDSVVRHCRRQFHPYGQRGSWTKEEDEQLEEAVEKYGRRWAKVGKIINRHPNHARDRYRDYVAAKGFKTGRWSAWEVRQLRLAVVASEAEQRAKYCERHGPLSDLSRPPSQFISASQVAMKLGSTRSRVQVQTKLGRLGIVGKAARCT